MQTIFSLRKMGENKKMEERVSMTRKEQTKLINHLKYIGADYPITSEDVDKAIKALEQNTKYRKEAKRWKNKALGQKQVLDKIRAEIERQEKWLWQAGIKPYNVDIAFSAIKSAVTESENKE